MVILAGAVALLLVAGALGYALLEKRPGYGAYYGLAKRMGSRLDIGPVDWAALTRHVTPNDALACPAAYCPHARPDWEPKTYTMTADALLARLKAVALAEPATRELERAPGRERSLRLLQHTRLMRFPDTIDVEALPAGTGSTLAIYSRSLVGRKDFGVNRARIARWLKVLDATG